MLLPFAVQLIHSFETHEHACNVNAIHIDSHEFNCSVFHFKIYQNSINFSSEVILVKNDISKNLIVSFESQLTSIQKFNKPSRAPPTLLI